MRIQLLTITLLCAGSFLAGAQSSSSSGIPRVNRPDDSLNPSSSTSSQGQSGSSSSSSSSGLSGSSTYGSGSHFGATGRMGHHEIRASKLNGSDIKTSSGEDLGKVEDIIINPGSGRIDFAVISYSGSTSAGTSSSSSTSSSTSSTTPSSSASPGSSIGGEKLVAVPWQLIRPSGMAGVGATATPSSSEQVSFVFTGEKSKLDSAPTFTQSNWPDISQPSWRQEVFSAFGVQPGAATGGSSGVGGSSSGSSSEGSTSGGPSTSPGSSSGSSNSPNSGSSTSPNSGSSSSSGSSGNP